MNLVSSNHLVIKFSFLIEVRPVKQKFYRTPNYRFEIKFNSKRSTDHTLNNMHKSFKSKCAYFSFAT